jgi:pyruvate dehydrogenase E2 component (dihydrolipoamide acetyltransferase)
MAETVLMPKLGFDMAEGTLVRWVKAEGETIHKGDVLAEIETDKATVEVESSFSGVVLKHLVAEKSIVPVALAIAIIGQPGEKVESAPAAPDKPAAPAEKQAASQPQAAAAAETSAVSAGEGGRVKASPLARKVAEDQKINLARLKGSGPGGRIVRKDVEQALAIARQPVPVPPAAAAQAARPAQPAALPLGSVTGQAPADEHVPVDRLRAAIGRRLAESKQQVPHFYVTHEYDMEALIALRKQANDLLPEEQKLSVNDFLVKAVALTLRQFPAVNASLAGNEIVRHGHVNVGVAVALDSGLLTVVCRDADFKPLRQISHEIKEMVARARMGKVRPDDIEGSTFSISNLGMYDVEHFIAIINPPESAILAVGSARQVPVVDGGVLRVGARMKATLSADHRVTDGAEGARFMQVMAGYIEKPLTLLV